MAQILVNESQVYLLADLDDEQMDDEEYRRRVAAILNVNEEDIRGQEVVHLFVM